MDSKFLEFLIITKKLNENNIVPLLMGSLGLEFVTKKSWDSQDIDIHVCGDPRGWSIPDELVIYEWDKIVAIMNDLGYHLIDLHEHKFLKNKIEVGYGVINTLPDFADVSDHELDYQTIDGIEFYTPSLYAFLKIYTSSSKDSYRANNNNKDFEKINYLMSLVK